MYATPGIDKAPPAALQAPPLLRLQPEQIEGVLGQLQAFWERFAPLFQRREQREWGLKYLQGHLMTTVRDRLPGPEVWLILRRDVVTGEIKSFLSNAPADTALARLAWLTAARWPVEQCIEEAKDTLHLNQYALRSWRGWYHHVTLILLAHLFLVIVRQALRAQASALTVPQVRGLLQVVLPQPVFDAAAALRVLHQIQQANYAAYRSHRQRTLRKLGAT